MAKPTKDAKPAKAEAEAKPKVTKPKPAKAQSAAPANAAQTDAKSGPLRSAGLLERVAERTGAKKQDLKPILEAVLEELGAALSRGEAFVLEPFGRGKVARSKSVEGGETLVIKLKRADAKAKSTDKADKKDAASPLASSDD